MEVVSEVIREVKSAQPGPDAHLETRVQYGPVCQHHCVIEKPAGPSSKGVCRLCGEEREFQNYVEGSSWGYDVSLEQLAGGSRLPVGVDTKGARGDSGDDEDS